MKKDYNITTLGRPAKPRSKKLAGLYNVQGTSSESASSDNNGAAALLKLNSMFSFVDAADNEVNSADDAVAIRVNNELSFYSLKEISAYGKGNGGGSSEGGSTQGSNVSYTATQTSGVKLGTLKIDGVDYQIFSPEVKSPTWNNIADKPAWLSDTLTSKVITDALGFTPYNSSDFTKANIKNTLGISDWALANTKPTYNLDEVEDGTTRKLSNYLLKSTFDELFEKVTANGVTYIKAKYGIASVDFISAYGVNSSGGSGGGTNVSFAQTLTSGTEIATITIEGIATKIYAPTIPTWETLSGKPTTISGYGITDAKIANGVITLGSNTITPLTSHQSLAGYATQSWVEGKGYLTQHQSLANYVQKTDSRLSDSRNAKDVYAWAKAATKPSYNFSEIGSKPTTISGYGITDAKINSGVITLGSNTMNPFQNRGGQNIDFNFEDSNNNNGVYYLHSEQYTQSNKNDVSYGSLLNISCSESSWQMISSSLGKLYYRNRWWSGGGNGWNAWKTIAFTDSNVASATKLATSRTLWGQSFDGSGNVSGSLSNVTNISLNGRIYNTEKASADTLILQGGSGMYLRFNETGIGVTDKDWNHTLYLKNNLTYSEITNNVNNIPICFTNYGNVGIGTTAPIHKLDVSINADNAYAGVFHNNNTSVFLAAKSTNALYVGHEYSDASHNIMMLRSGETGLGSNGIVRMVVRADGNVGIGTTSPSYPLEVNGNVGISYSRGDVYYRATRSDTNNSIWFGVGSGGTNRGIYSPSHSAWMIYTDGTNTILNCGFVGIGTDTPARKFVVSNGGAKGIEIDSTYETNDELNNYMGNIVAYDRSGKAWKALGLGGSNVQIRTISSGTIKAFTFTNSAFVSPVEVTAYSDARLKSNIKPLCFRGELKPRTFVKDGKYSIGFIAQEVRELYPELVLGNEEDGYLSLNYGAITAILACQTNDHEARIKALENENMELKRKLKMIA